MEVTGPGTGPAVDPDSTPGPAVDAGTGTGSGTGPAVEADTDPALGPGSPTDIGPGPVPGAAPDLDPSTAEVSDPLADPDVEAQPRGGFRCRLCQISAANREYGDSGGGDGIAGGLRFTG